MKKILRVLICTFILVFMLLSLTACKGTYKVTVVDPYDCIIEDLSETYKEGETVTVKTAILHDSDLIAYLNGVRLKPHTPIGTDDSYTHWEFYFVMPDHDVVLTFEEFGSK